MHIQSLSVVVGTRACNANCPFCVSKMTGFTQVDRAPRGDFSTYAKGTLQTAIDLAIRSNCTTCLITGKGEPTLYPGAITSTLREVGGNFPLVELQTNGVLLHNMLILPDSTEPRPLSRDTLRKWRRLGLNTIALSTAGFVLPRGSGTLDEDEALSNKRHRSLHVRLRALNAEHYTNPYFDLPWLVRELQDFGFTVRVCVMAQKGGIDTLEDVQAQVYAAKEADVDQLTIRPITEPSQKGADALVRNYVINNQPECFTSTWGTGAVPPILRWAQQEGTLIRRLAGGGEVYDVNGQNLGIYNCLTVDEGGDLRSLIHYPNGEVSYSWVHPGARFLGPGPESRRRQRPPEE